MSKSNASKERDAMKEKLMALSSGVKAPGQNQASKVLREKEPETPEPEKEPARKATASSRIRSAPKNGSESKGPKLEVKKRDGMNAEKLSVSLHPQDQERAEKVEDALRAEGLIARRAPTSFLLKVALAAFDPTKVEDLKSLVEEVKAQDGRGKWMQDLKSKKS